MELNASNRKDGWPRQHLATACSRVGESLEEAAKTAAYKVAEAENKAFTAAEAVKDAEKLAKMVEETDSILQLAKEIFDRCNIFYSISQALHLFSSPASSASSIVSWWQVLTVNLSLLHDTQNRIYIWNQ